MKKLLIVLLLVVISVFCFAAGSKEIKEKENTVAFTDSCNRVVYIPSEITKVSPAGPVATMVLECIAPEYMCSVSGSTASENLKNLPKTGNLFGGKSSINVEELLRSGTQLIIDIGDYKKGIEADLDALQAQTGIPCIFISQNLSNMADTFRTLGSVLYGKKERSEEIATFIDRTMETVYEARSKIKDSEVVRVMYSGNADGLGTNPKGSSQAQVLEFIGCENAVILSNANGKSFGNQINAEVLYSIDPEVILFAPDSIFDSVASDKTWQVLDAVKQKKYYEVPSKPYNYLGNPSSVNMILGVYWLGNLLYPQYYSYNVEEKINEAIEVLWKNSTTN